MVFMIAVRLSTECGVLCVAGKKWPLIGMGERDSDVSNFTSMNNYINNSVSVTARQRTSSLL